MNPTMILAQLMAEAARNPARTSTYAQRTVNSQILDPFASVLPRRTGSSYSFDGSDLAMVVSPLLPTALNSPYAPIGAVKGSKWQGETDKYSGTRNVDERLLRGIHQDLISARAFGQSGDTLAANFLQKLLDAMRDSADLAEKMARFQAVMEAKYTFVGAKSGALLGAVDYGVQRITPTSTKAYDKAGSTFWADLLAAEPMLIGNVAKRYISEPVYIKIKANPVNGIIEDSRTTNADGTYTVTISRLAVKADGTFDTASNLRDAQYSEVEFTVVKPQTFETVNADGTVTKSQFGVSRNIAITGSNVLGQLYVAPTTEGQSRGVPNDRCVWVEDQAAGRAFEYNVSAVENMVPVIEDYENVVLLETGVTL